jgi:broad specificity phosphatase PhoE
MFKNFQRVATTLLILSSFQVMAAPYQLYLVRHAHKADAGKDPVLSACGKAQASALATLLAKVPLTKLYHTQFQRTRQTAAALETADRLLLSYQAAELKTLATKLLQQQEPALVVGHSNTVPELAALLSKQPQQPLTEQDYGGIYQLQFNERGFISLTQLQLPMPEICQPRTSAAVFQ